jgi:hypothetical protein
MKASLSLVLLTFVVASCVQTPPVTAEADGTAAKSKGPTSRPTKKAVSSAGRLDEKSYQHFGDGVAAKGEAITLATLAAQSKELVGKKVRVTGEIKAVCKKKGCWMILADGTQQVRIQFRDYGFFVPLDCEGRTAVLEGTFDVSETSVADLKHLLEDEGKKEEAAKVTEPRIEMKVMADGVALTKK